MRIIRDSDDEFDDEDLEGEATASKGKVASPRNTDTIDASLQDEPGTGSTDSLKRAIETAHRVHLGSPSIPSLPTAQPNPSNYSSAERINKRRKTTADVSLGLPLGTVPASKKPPKTYGRSKSIHSSPYLDPGQVSPTVGDAEDVVEKMWALEGTLRDNYAAHEPMAMFLEPSSTVPNATYTQQRLLDEVMNPAFLGIEPEAEAPRYQPAKSSVPWSDFLHTPSGYTETQCNSQDAHGTRSSLDDEQVAFSAARSSGPSQVLQAQPQLQPPIELNFAQHSGRSPSTQPRESLLRNEVTRNGVNPRDIVNAPAVAYLETGDVPASLTPSRPKYSPITPSKDLPADGRRRSPERQNSLPSKAMHNSSSVLNLEDDVEAIGIPEEKYRPRPSRSRSLKVDLEHPVDYSVRPEKASKRQPRRSKTTGGIENATPQLTPQKVQQLYDMGFTPKMTQRALKENSNNVDQTIHWLLANGALDDELAPPRASKSTSEVKPNITEEDASHQVSEQEDVPSLLKRNRRVSSNASTIVAIGYDDVPRETSATNPTLIDKSPKVRGIKSPKVQVVIPKSKEAQNQPFVKEQTKANTCQKVDLVDAPSRKPKRRKTTLDQPEPAEEHAVASPIPTKGQKRGRGRPRKEAMPSISSAIIHEDEEEPQDELVLEQIQPKITPLAGATVSKDMDKPPKATTPHITERPASTPLAKTTLAETSRTPEKVPKTATDSHSPLSKGKVPYRVGLSKRARIAPLLRVMKK